MNIPSPQSEWLPEYDTLLEIIASTDVVDSDWEKLKDIIKRKIEKNISLFLSASQPTPAPELFPPISLPGGGLKLPPFPPRKPMRIGEIPKPGESLITPSEPPVNYMTEEQANDIKERIFEQLDMFEGKPPFTIQRLCELCANPQQHYKSVGKYLRAVEKSILVTSTTDVFPPLTESELNSSGRSAIVLGPTSQSAPSTPLFSPIPFLHDDARRSKSRSPPPTPLSLAAVIPGNEQHPDAIETRALGLVDELDDPSPGHMSDHPTAISSVTTVSSDTPHPRPFLGSLDQRFVKSEESSSTGETDNMVLDEDKENSKA